MHTLGWLAMGILATSCAAGAQGLPVPDPKTGLFATRADVESMRRRTETLPWAKDMKARILRTADAWVARDDAWIRAILPPAGARFAYGVSGCPACGKGWKNFGANVCSLDRPEVLECPNCHAIFDLNDPKPEYADTGRGVKVNGQIYYLRGVWNAFVVNSMWSAFQADASAVVNLGDAYALTGDPRYAHKLAVIADALATLAPGTTGPRDFNPDPNTITGRLQHLTSIVFRAQVVLARSLDLCANAPDFAAPSPTSPGRTVWENIRKGLYDDYMFVPFNTRNGNLTTLHNHEADSVRGLLVAGILFGDPDYVRWGAQSAVAFLDNTIDRDGLYYETSLSYTAFTRSVFVSMADALANYDPARYPGVKMPARAELPYGGNLFNHPRLARLALDAPDRLDIAGRQPTYGNNHFDTEVWKQTGRPFIPSEFEEAERFLLHATDPQIRARAKAIVAAGSAASAAAGHSDWALYHQPESLPSGGAKREAREPDAFGNTGLTFLRSGSGAARRGAVMRFGPNMPHAHNDQGALMLFAQGRALSGDIGYGIFGNHVHLGWATQPVSHNLVVVNQDLTDPRRLFRPGPGGDVVGFAAVPGVSMVEADLTRLYAPEDAVRLCRRTVFQVDLSSSESYWVDLYDIDGGHVHDYSFHARPLDKDGSFDISAPVAPVPGAWTLAGLDPANKDASYNAPGRAWGERLTVGGLLRQIPGLSDVDEKPWWYAPPGNGYGFLYDVRAADATDPWMATWRFSDAGDRYAMRLYMVPESRQQVISATGPTLTGADRMQWVIARSGDPADAKPVRTRYAAVIGVGSPEPSVRKAEAIRRDDRVVGLRVSAGDREDTVLDAREGPVGGLSGGMGIVRRKAGALEALVLTAGGSLEADGVRLALTEPRLRSRIVKVDDSKGGFRVSPALPAASTGSLIVVRGKGYARASSYRVAKASAAGDVMPLRSDTTLGRGYVAAVAPDGFTSSAPLPYANAQELPYRTLDGKRIVYGEHTGHILAVDGFKGLRVSGPPAKAGDSFTVFDVQQGDTVEMAGVASATRNEAGEWMVRANEPCTVTFPYDVERRADGKWMREASRTVQVAGEAVLRRRG